MAQAPTPAISQPVCDSFQIAHKMLGINYASSDEDEDATAVNTNVRLIYTRKGP